MSKTGNGKRPVNVAILGATGRVGQEMLRILEERNFPVAKLKALASERSKNAVVTFQGKPYPVEQASTDSFQDIDIVLASAGAETSKRLAPYALEAGAILIDNSSAFRMSESVPLVVPE